MTRRLRGLKSAFAVALLIVSGLVKCASAQTFDQEKVEAAITLQILSFTEWPESATSDRLTIGVVGSDDSYQAFTLLAQDERYRDKYEIVKIESGASDETLDTLQAIFFSKKDPIENPRLIRKVGSRPIVLVGAHDNFLELGGMINLVKRQRRLSFEIHLGHAKAHDIAFRAKLLRLAANVIRE